MADSVAQLTRDAKLRQEAQAPGIAAPPQHAGRPSLLGGTSLSQPSEEELELAPTRHFWQGLVHSVRARERPRAPAGSAASP